MPEAPNVPKAVRQTRDVDLDRLFGVLDGLSEQAGGILRFIAVTGCRSSEACRLEWRHVHLDAGLCILPEHKTADETGEPRTIFLTDEAAAILQTMTPTIGPVFTSRLGNPYTPAGLRSILKRHGGITPYQLRHAFAQHASDGGEVPLEVLARLMGHRNVKTTEFYFKIRDRRAVQAAKTIRLQGAKAVG